MKQLEADVVVISAGTAGLTAVVTAAEGGASVIAFEKAARSGGTANHAGGLFAVESRFQRLKRYTLTREEAFKIYMDFTHWRVNARLVKAFIDKSASTIDWLEGLGVEFLDVLSHNPGFHYTWHVVKGPLPGPWPLGPSSAMMKILANRAEELGARIFLKTPVKRILKEGGRIVGLIAEDKSGEEIQAKTKAVITATGGYSGGAMPGMPGLVGDGIRLAREVGAATVEPRKVAVGRRSSRPPGRLGYAVPSTFQQPNLIVNLLGERFVDEEVMVTSPFGGNAVARQKDGTAFSIYDEDTKNYYAETGLDVAGGDFIQPITKASNFDAELKQLLDQGAGNIFVANSLEELASKTGIGLNGLRKTIDEYNKACETGRDEAFNKNPRYLRPVKKPRFYASKVAGDTRIWGGIRINYKTEVLTRDYEVIPGLYTAGMDAACEIYSDTYPFILPASAMGFAINSGRMAAESALEYIKSVGK
jgi:fumarate reductase flavoprotein subunit